MCKNINYIMRKYQLYYKKYISKKKKKLFEKIFGFIPFKKVRLDIKYQKQLQQLQKKLQLVELEQQRQNYKLKRIFELIKIRLIIKLKIIEIKLIIISIKSKIQLLKLKIIEFIDNNYGINVNIEMQQSNKAIKTVKHKCNSVKQVN